MIRRLLYPLARCVAPSVPLRGVLCAVLLAVACERAPVTSAPIVLQLQGQQGTTVQTARIRTPVPVAPSVRLIDGDGRPVGGRRVVFFATKGSGSVLPAEPLLTDANGVAALTSWTLGASSGLQQLTAVIADATADTRVVFDANATPGVPSLLDVGVAQRTSVIGSTFAVPAVLRDADGNAVTTPDVAQYISSMPAVASVDGGGVVTAIAPGTSTISVTRATFVATVTLTVVSPPSAFTATVASVAGPANGIAISSTNTIYVTHTDRRPLTRFALPSEAVAGTVSGTGFSIDVTFLPDGSRAYVASDTNLIVVNTSTHSAIDTLRMPGGSVYRVLASANGQFVYVTTNDGQFARINTATRAVTTFATNGEPLNGIALHPTRPVLLATSVNGSLYEIDLATFTLTRTLAIGGMPQGIAVAPDGSRIYIARESAALDVRDGTTLERITSPNVGFGAFDVKVTPNGRYLIVSLSARVAVFDATNFVQYQTFVADNPRRIAINASGTLVMVATLGREVFFLR